MKTDNDNDGKTLLFVRGSNGACLYVFGDCKQQRDLVY